MRGTERIVRSTPGYSEILAGDHGRGLWLQKLHASAETWEQGFT